MRQRLCLAHTLVHDPTLLILDEPASGLDPRARVEMREILRELRAMGKTILVSSHILPELGEMCTGVAIIDHGRVLRSGSISEIERSLARPRCCESTFSATRRRSRPRPTARNRSTRRRRPAGGEHGRLVAPGGRLRRDGDEQADLLRSMVEAGHRVVGFARRRAISRRSS